MLRFNLNILYYIGFILLFFNCFIIFIYKNWYIPVASACQGLLLILLFTFSFPKFKKFARKIFSLPIIKYYFYFLIFIHIDILFHYLLGNYLPGFWGLFASWYRFMFAWALVYFFVPFAAFFNINMNKLIKFFYIIIFCTFIIGVIQYLGYVFNIGIIDKIIFFFKNQQIFFPGDFEYNYAGRMRVASIFEESGIFAQFIFVILPFILNINKSKFKLFKNNLINIIFKRTLLVLTYVCLVFTKSPIYFILVPLETVLWLLYTYKKFVKKHLFSMLVLSGTVVFCLFIAFTSFYTQLEETFIGRIINTFRDTTDFYAFATNEPSLAIRISDYLEQLIAWKNHFWTGVGPFNFFHYGYNLIAHQKTHFLLATNIAVFFKGNGTVRFSEGIFYVLVSESGFIGLFLYSLFLGKNIIFMYKIQKKLYGLEQVFANSICQTMVATIIISFYNYRLWQFLLWMIFGLALLELYRYKYCIKQENN